MSKFKTAKIGYIRENSNMRMQRMCLELLLLTTKILIRKTDERSRQNKKDYEIQAREQRLYNKSLKTAYEREECVCVSNLLLDSDQARDSRIFSSILLLYSLAFCIFLDNYFVFL